MTILYWNGKIVFFDECIEYQVFLAHKLQYPDTLVLVDDEWGEKHLVPYKHLSWGGCEEKL